MIANLNSQFQINIFFHISGMFNNKRNFLSANIFQPEIVAFYETKDIISTKLNMQ